MTIRILVTGGTGMLGKAVQRIVQENDNENVKWTFIDSSHDLRDANVTKQLFEKCKPDRVLHLAAKVGGLFDNIQNNADFYIDNTLINTMVLKAAYEHNVDLTISSMSTCVFPTSKSEIVASDIHNGPPHDSNMGYAYAKRGLEIMSTLLNEKGHRQRFACVSPCNLYGPFDHFGKASAHVIPALIHKFANTDKSSVLVLKGTGTARRQFMHVDDLATFLVDIMMQKETVDKVHIIVAPKEEYAIKDIAEILSSRYNVKYQFDGDVKMDGQMRKYAIGTEPKSQLSFKEHLLQVCDWYDNERSSLS
jgi:GDP-L-fucose synthase